jgi:predicted NBD/HSP70 family sugar kinase
MTPTPASLPSDGLIVPRRVPPLDPTFRPSVLAARAFRDAVRATGRAQRVGLALEQVGGVFHFEIELAPPDHPLARFNAFRLVRFMKFLLWSRGGHRIHVDGPVWVADTLRAHYRDTKTGQFDAHIMGTRTYEKPFEIVSAPGGLPPARGDARPLGRHLNGCRIGFDLGASDRKVSAVIDGEVKFTEEVGWNPVVQKDATWHFNEIMSGLKSAAAHLPRVDAIGGSSAGLIIANRVRVASLFRGVPPEQFDTCAAPIFAKLRKAWDDIPFDVVNDGEVTALAGAMEMDAGAVLGIALGSSEAAGYVTPEGGITPWLNELAFAPIDDRPDAPPDEWSAERGCGVQYLSQQAVGRLLAPAGIEVEAGLSLPEKLVQVQKLMEANDPRAERIYRTIGVFLGYAVAHYTDFYDVRNVLILGRVTSGAGGGILLEEAAGVLKSEFPDLAERVQWRTPDERSKRHGQAVVAASLPVLPPGSRPADLKRILGRA